MKRSLAASIVIVTSLGLGLSQAPHKGSKERSPATHWLSFSTPNGAAPVSAVKAPAEPDQSPLAPPPPAEILPDPDIITVESPLNQAMLNALVRNGEVGFDLPDGRTLTLIVDSVDEHRGYQRIRLGSTGELNGGLFTRSEHGFFGTVATDRGVYALENQGLKTYIVDHSELDRRNLPGLSDARRPREA